MTWTVRNPDGEGWRIPSSRLEEEVNAANAAAVSASEAAGSAAAAASSSDSANAAAAAAASSSSSASSSAASALSSASSASADALALSNGSDAIATVQAAGDAGLSSLAAAGTDEARTSLGVGEKRILLGTSGASYVLDPDDIGPGAVHQALLYASGQSVRIDVAALRYWAEYVFVNDSVFDCTLEIDCGAELYFQLAGGPLGDTTNTTLSLKSGQMARLRRTNITLIRAQVTDGHWSTVGDYRYRRMSDGTYQIDYTHPGGLAATTATTKDFATAFNLDNARVDAITVQPSNATQPASPPQLYKMGTPHGYTQYRIAIYNPNAATITAPMRFLISNVTRA